MRRVAVIAAILWAGPWTCVGLLLGLLGLATGGRVQRSGRVIEFHGGVLRGLLARAPIVGGAAAITLGHVVLGQTPDHLRHSRRHERVHVRQYERWGLLFLPAYLGSSLWAWMRGRHPYYDNAFEREAFEIDD